MGCGEPTNLKSEATLCAPAFYYEIQSRRAEGERAGQADFVKPSCEGITQTAWAIQGLSDWHAHPFAAALGLAPGHQDRGTVGKSA